MTEIKQKDSNPTPRIRFRGTLVMLVQIALIYHM